MKSIYVLLFLVAALTVCLAESSEDLYQETEDDDSQLIDYNER